MVRLTGLCKTFATERGEVKAVDEVDFEIKEGEFFTLLGPSGCGKSTTLRCIAGLEKPEYGEITIGEQMVFSAEKNLFIELAAPSDIYLRPRGYFTADFIGACNFLPGTILNRDKDFILVGTEIGELSCASSENTPSEIVVGIRPEHIELIKKGEELGKKQNVVQGTVVSAIFLGSTIDCTVKVGSKQLRVQVLSSKHVIDGEEVHLCLLPHLCIPLSEKQENMSFHKHI